MNNQNPLSRRVFMGAALLAALVGMQPFALGQPGAAPVVESEEAPAAAPAELKIVAVVAGASYQELRGDISFLGSLAGQPEIAESLEAGLAFFTQGKALPALDQTKPWGLIVRTDGQSFPTVGCLPVTKPDDLLEIATNYGAQITELDNEVKQLSLPDDQVLFAKVVRGWAFVGQSAEVLERVPENPEAAFGRLVTDYDIAAMVSVKNVPEMYRAIAIGAMQSGMQEGLQRNEEETDEQFASRQEIARVQMEQVVDLINEIDSLTFGWAIDSEDQRSYMDFTYSFAGEGKMASQLNAMEPPTTNFAGFYQPHAVGTMTVAQQVDLTKLDADELKTQQEQARAMLATYRLQLRKFIQDELEISDEEAREALAAAAEELMDAVVTSTETGKMDAGAALNVKPGEFTLVAGAYLLEPAKVQSALQRLVPVVDRLPHVSSIQMNAATHGEITFHRVTFDVPEDEEEARKVLGEQAELSIGIGEDAVYLALGNNHLDVLKEAIDASLSEPNKSVPMFELAVALGPIMDTVAVQVEEGDQRATAQRIADMLRNDAQGRDHIRMLGHVIPDGLRYRIEVEEGVLRAIGAAITDAQRRGMEAADQQQGPQ